MNRLLITETLHSREDFYSALATAPLGSPAPTPKNLDGLADFVREKHLECIICADWKLTEADSAALLHVLDDVGVKFHR